MFVLKGILPTIKELNGRNTTKEIKQEWMRRRQIVKKELKIEGKFIKFKNKNKLRKEIETYG